MSSALHVHAALYLRTDARVVQLLAQCAQHVDRRLARLPVHFRHAF